MKQDITTWIYLIILITFYYLIARNERNKKYPICSPINCLIFPLLVNILFAQTVGTSLGFIDISKGAIFVWGLGMFSFWLGGISVSSRPTFESMLDPNYKLIVMPKQLFVMNTLCTLFILISFYELFVNIRTVGLNNLSKGEFGAHGVVGHISNFIMGFCMYYSLILKSDNISNRISKLKPLIFVLSIIFLKLMTGIRGNIVIPIIGSFIVLSCHNKINIRPKILLLIGLLAILFFVGTTYIFQSTESESDYFFQYIVFYIVAGVSGLSAYMSTQNPLMGSNPAFILTFFNNLLIAITGGGEKYNNIVQENWTSATADNSDLYFGSNVYTLIGDIFINEGYILGCLYFFLLGYISYWLFYRIINNIYITVAYGCVASCLVMGLFGQYTIGIFFHTTTLLFLLFNTIFKKYKRSNL